MSYQTPTLDCNGSNFTQDILWKAWELSLDQGGVKVLVKNIADYEDFYFHCDRKKNAKLRQ